MKANGNIIVQMAKVSLPTQMVACMRVNGEIASQTVREFTTI